MRILTWNICRGRRDVNPLARALAEIAADVLVLTEFRANGTGARLLSELQAYGYEHSIYRAGLPKSSGVALISRHRMAMREEEGPHRLAHRWKHVSLVDKEIDLLGVYLNGSPGPPETTAQKQAFWDRIHVAAERLIERPTVIIGDLNTGLHRIDEEGATFRCSESFRVLLQLGWIDAFRALHGDRREYTWWSNRRGFRLDHAFLSPQLAQSLKSANYIARTASYVLAHTRPRPWPRELGTSLSDHSALIVELDR